MVTGVLTLTSIEPRGNNKLGLHMYINATGNKRENYIRQMEAN